MSGNLDTYLHVMAAATGNALARAGRCHLHLAAGPMAIVTYKLAGDAATPVAVMYGTDPASPKLLAAPEPRSREIRFELLNEFMADLLAWARSASDSEAPQLLVANPATAEFLGVLGRSLRHPPRNSQVPPATVLGARHLAWLAERAEHPGSAVIIPMTLALAQHWRTGQSDLEDSQLTTALAWIAPRPDAPGAAPAKRPKSPGEAARPDRPVIRNGMSASSGWYRSSTRPAAAMSIQRSSRLSPGRSPTCAGIPSP